MVSTRELDGISRIWSCEITVPDVAAVVSISGTSAVTFTRVILSAMIRRPPRSTRVRSSAASDVYKRQVVVHRSGRLRYRCSHNSGVFDLSLIHISEPTRLLSISYAVFCLKKKKKKI